MNSAAARIAVYAFSLTLSFTAARLLRGQEPSNASSLLDSTDAALKRGSPDDLRRAVTLARAATEAARRAADHPTESRALLMLARAYSRVGSFDSALAIGREQLARARAVHDTTAELLATFELAVAFWRKQEPDSLMWYSRTGLELALEVPAIEIAVHFANGMVTVYLIRGQPDSAEATARVVVDIATRMNIASALETARSNAFQLASAMFKAGIDSAGGYPNLGSRPAGFVPARRLWRLASALFAAADRHGESISALLAIADNYLLQGLADSALMLARHGAELAAVRSLTKEENIALQIRVRAFQALEQMDSATVLLRLLAARSGDPGAERMSQAIAEFTRTTDQVRRGQLDSAITSFERVLADARHVKDEHVEAFALLSLGAVYWRGGRIEGAARVAEQAARLSSRLADTATSIGSFMLLGATLEQLGALDSALAVNRRAYALAKAKDDRERLGHTALNLGFFWQRRGEYDSARTYLELSSRVAGFAGYPAARLALATIANERRDFAAAIEHARSVLENTRAGGRVRMRARRMIGRAMLAAGRRDSAIVYLRAALTDARALGLAMYQMWAFSDLAAAHVAPGHLDSLRTAVAYADSAAVLAARARRWAGGDELQLEAAEQASDVFEVWALAWSLISAANADGGAALAALAASERGRGQTLLDLMRRTEEEHAPGANLADEAQKLVTATVRPGSMALEYLITGAGLLIWSATPDGLVRVEYRKVTRDSLANLVRQLRAALGADEAAERRRLGTPATRGVRAVGAKTSRKGVATTARRLGDLLLPRDFFATTDSGTEVIIVPSGMIGLVPFATLPVGPNARPLGLRHALRYTPSLATLQEVEARKNSLSARARAREAPLVVGDPAMPTVLGADGKKFQLKQLPGAAAEARSVAMAVAGRLVEGPAATETTIRQRLGGATLIHMATHGYAYATQARARESYVALAKDSLHDGLLSVGDVLDDVQLNAELVVLSACQTGLGDVKEAEGTVGLQRAFLAKGARSILVSLWSVSDEATRILMQRFYAHWLQDADEPSKAEALRRSQVDLRAIPRFNDPLYWASFQLVGAH